jgi:ABC-2 type transport system ATP-binding protein
LSRLSRDEGVAILITTHYMSEAEHCDRLALMYAGRVVTGGSPGDMKQHVEQEAGHLFEVIADQPAKAVLELRRAGFAGAALYGTRVHLFCRDPVRDKECACQALASRGVTIQSVTARPLTLEDVFVYKVMALEEQDRAAAPGGSV